MTRSRQGSIRRTKSSASGVDVSTFNAWLDSKNNCAAGDRRAFPPAAPAYSPPGGRTRTPVQSRRSPRRISNLPAEPEEGRAEEWPRIAPQGAQGLVCAISAARGMVMAGLRPNRACGASGHGRDMARWPNKAASSPLIRRSRGRGCQGRARRKAEAGKGSIESGLAGRPFLFSLICEIGSALWSLWNPVAVDRRPG
jgi:hypothetical protein